jgi:N-acetylmuramoyl-L-alanine amidase
MAGTIIVLAGASAGLAKKLVVIPYEGTIVLDPGHGGHDQGARGSDGTLEKAVTLSLARRVAAGLNQNYRAVLTRTDDYGLDIPGRTAIANHEKAKIFISLHSGGSFLHQATQMSVYFFEELIDPCRAVGQRSKAACGNQPQVCKFYANST